MMCGVSSDERRHDDDFTDRLNSKYTVLICLASCLVVSASLFVNDPINCWTPAHFSGSHEKYTSQYCWIRNTYYLDFDEEIPHEGQTDHEAKTITYYQWIPFILVGQAILFYMPSVFWHAYNQRAGVDADTILNTAKTLDNAVGDKDDYSEKIKIVLHQMDRFLVARTSGVRSTSHPIQHKAKYSFVVHSSRR